MNQLKVNEQQAIVTLAARGWSRRRIARELGIDRGTVRKYLEPAKPAISTAGSDVGADSKPAISTAGSTGLAEPKPAILPPGLWRVDEANASRTAIRSRPDARLGSRRSGSIRISPPNTGSPVATSPSNDSCGGSTPTPMRRFGAWSACQAKRSRSTLARALGSLKRASGAARICSAPCSATRASDLTHAN